MKNYEELLRTSYRHLSLIFAGDHKADAEKIAAAEKEPGECISSVHAYCLDDQTFINIVYQCN